MKKKWISFATSLALGLHLSQTFSVMAMEADEQKEQPKFLVQNTVPSLEKPLLLELPDEILHHILPSKLTQNFDFFSDHNKLLQQLESCISDNYRVIDFKKVLWFTHSNLEINEGQLFLDLVNQYLNTEQSLFKEKQHEDKIYWKIPEEKRTFQALKEWVPYDLALFLSGVFLQKGAEELRTALQQSYLTSFAQFPEQEKLKIQAEKINFFFLSWDCPPSFLDLYDEFTEIKFIRAFVQGDVGKLSWITALLTNETQLPCPEETVHNREMHEKLRQHLKNFLKGKGNHPLVSLEKEMTKEALKWYSSNLNNQDYAEYNDLFRTKILLLSEELDK